MSLLFSSKILVFSCAMLCVSITACSTAVQPSVPVGHKTSETQKPNIESDWRLERIADKAGNLKALPSNSSVNLDLQQGKISGNGGCNRYFGSYRLQGEQIRLESLGSTMRACADIHIMDLEQQFFERLAQTVSYRIEAGQMQFLDTQKKPLLVFIKSEQEP